ncbi:MAG TPA: YajG family lipoprotein [Candidatus Wunengus sp. YC61]|uniref:YajG family lipoprotein n=1 Tax=Candidatus Wunengus sp. YC61 TaxID=3367698 RepID=UPI004024FFDD
MRKCIWVMVFVLFMSGCAFSGRRLMLNYSVVLPPAAKNNIVVKVDKLKDERTWSKTKVGDVKNGYGMRCSEIIPQNDVCVWITDALKAELTNAGYTVNNDAAANNIGGAVLEVYTDAWMNYGGRIRLNVVLKKDGKDILTKNYAVQKNCGLNWAATTESYAKTLELTLQDVMRQIIPDIDTALK